MTAPNRFPGDTTVVNMGIGPANAQKLTDAGKKVTKDDLVALWGGVTTPNAAKATLGDIDVIKKAFEPSMAATQPGEAGGCACCCTPCCCASAVIRPISKPL